MASLKNTLIQGSARVTDTLYANNLKTASLNADLLTIKTSVSGPDLTNGINISDGTTVYGHISSTTGGNICIYTTGTMYLRPGSGSINSTEGMTLSTTELLPKNGTIALGGTSNRWNGVYSTTGNFTGTLTLSKTTDASGTANNSPALIVGGAATSTHLELDANEIMAKTDGTSVAALYLNNEGGPVTINGGYGTTSVSTGVDSGLNVYSRRAANSAGGGAINVYSSFAASSGAYQWGYNHLAPNAAAGAHTCLLTGVANSNNNQAVFEFSYAGSNDANNYVAIGLYTNEGLVKAYKDKHVEVDTLKITNTSAVAHLTFSRTDNPNYIVVPDSKYLIINNGTTIGTAYAALGITKTEIYNAFGGNIGSSTYYWGNIYAKGYIYMKGLNQYPLDFFLYNKTGNQVGEMWYDHGATDTVTTGRFGFREFSPNSTATATTTGKHETFYLPTVTTGRTDNATYTIITTKNLSSITSVGTITSGTWNGSAIPVANGGTGATTAANARTNLGLGSAATYNISNGSYHSTNTLIPTIRGGDGVMEIGKYIDFHVDAASTKDYDARITASTTGLTLSGTTSGTFSGSLTGNASSATKIAAKLAATTKTYLLGTSTTITGTAANVELIGDTGVYLTTTSGELSAVKYSINSSGTEKINLQYDTTTDILNFVFV